MKICPSCRHELLEISRYCTRCGQRLHTDLIEPTPSFVSRIEPQPAQLNLQILYGMVAVLTLAVLFPPWEASSSQAPEFYGFQFILMPPTPDAIVSRVLLTIELTTVTIVGLYGSFLFRSKL